MANELAAAALFAFIFTVAVGAIIAGIWGLISFFVAHPIVLLVLVPPALFGAWLGALAMEAGV